VSRSRPDGERWLSAAITGELPEPALRRWQPLRVGIVNLWEYDQAEFWFADGRLVLRGGNGAGKTKVLELTTLMLLRGEIGPAVLDPFGSQHRTMRFNLLPTGDGDDPRPPSDAGLGYAWAEFGRIDDDGTPRFFVCGLGVSARRGSGTSTVTPWHLITQLRPGRDLQLCPAGRPLDLKELRKIPGVAVPDGAARYRARLATDLFGLGPDAYDNLTELLKQLRRPKLGERLNPASLAETLRAALPPLAAAEITQLADGWDNLERLRTAVEETRTAAVRLAAFVRTGWTPWAKAVVRRRADALASATTRLDDTTKARRAAEKDVTTARTQVTALAEQVVAARQRQRDLGTELRELLDSQAYQDALSAASRVDSLREQFDGLTEQRGGVERRHTGAAGEVSVATAAVDEAATMAVTAEEDAACAAGRVAEAARPAGLHDSAQQHLPTRDLPSLRVDLTVRRERFARLRTLRAAFDIADRAVTMSANSLAARQKDLTEATGHRDEAREHVTAAVDTVRRQIREWNAVARLAATDERSVEDWCDLVAELTTVDTADVGGARRRSPAVAIAQHIDSVGGGLRSRLATVEHQRSSLIEEQDRLEAELQETLARAERPPDPPSSWRRRERPDPDSGHGAPFWRCVQPVAGLTADELDLLEATLSAAGLLDAWIAPDGRLAGAADTLVLTAATHTASTLAAVLEPTPAGGVPAGAIGAVLAGIGWHAARPADDDRTGTWVAADGTWRCATLIGRAQPARPASYLGATAREAARQRAVELLRTRLADLEASVTQAGATIAALQADLLALADEAARVPAERPVTDAVTILRERDRAVADRQHKTDLAAELHRRNEADRDDAWATFATFAGEHALPLDDLTAHDGALQDYHQAVEGLSQRLEVLVLRTAARDRAARDLAAARQRFGQVDAELKAVRERARQAEVRLRTAEEALTSDVRARLGRRNELDELVRKAEDMVTGLGDEHTAAQVRVTRAEGVLAGHEERRAVAERQRDATLSRWWEVHDAGLAQPLGLDGPDRRTVDSALDSARAARRGLPDAVDEDRAWRQCYSRLDTLRQQLLPDRDALVREAEHDGAVPRVMVLADGTTGWQSPSAAADLLAEQVRTQETAFDSEQQRVLTTLLGSTFIEHLKDRLDYTARTFTDINEQLTSHPTRHGNAVRLRWEPDPGDPDAGTVVDALTQGYHQLSPARQETVRAFLARRIDAARADAAAGSGDWRDQLATALDYRGWLRISLQYRPGSTSQWTPFDAARHGAKSGGEKVVLLSQPLFAAAVVAYNAAGEHAPRCVWLDEAMTGVDEEIKASFMGLTVGFDLDVMLTAHDEWCKYPTVPAVAVYDLARHRGLPGVDIIPYLWCGGEWTAVALGVTTSPSSEELLVSGGLFAADGR
jgi:uncharacterized protein (TIGR02680 family)